MRLGLREALRRAGERHVEVLAARERVQQAIQRLGQARSAWLPHVTAGASQIRQTRNLEASGLTFPGQDPLIGPFNAFDARLKLSQTLFDAGAIQRFRAAAAGRALSLAESRKARQDALALVAALFIEAQRATAKIELAHAVLIRDQERLRAVQRRSGLGMSSWLDARQAEAAFTESLHQFHAALAEAVERQLDLRAVLDLPGEPSEQPIVLLDEADTLDDTLPPRRAIESAVETHPDVERATQALKTSRAERAAELGDFLPRLSVAADYGASGEEPSNSEATYTFGAQVSMPIFEGGLRAARVREAGSRVRESQDRLHDVERHVEAQALSAVQAVKQAAVLCRAAENELSVAATRYRLAKQRRAGGIGSDLDVVEARAEAAFAADQYGEGLAAYQLARVNLAHALGDVERMPELAEVP